MVNIFKRIIRKSTKEVRHQVERILNLDPVIDNDERFRRIRARCKPYTMTSKAKMYALYKAVEYVIHAKILGDFVECGVWRGGSMMLIAHTLRELNVTNRKIFLYDTFEGMAKPTEEDRQLSNKNAPVLAKWKEEAEQDHNNWCYASLSDVKANMALTGYPENNLVFVKGKIEDTVPRTMPSRIALLRLDTDWYESTNHELRHLFPRLSKKGVLILDDYGHWAGSKKAVDDYFFRKPILLNRIDPGGRIGLKD